MPARLSLRSNGRKTPRAARSNLRARWWSACMPRWQGAPSRSRTRSPGWRSDLRLRALGTETGSAFARGASAETLSGRLVTESLDGRRVQAIALIVFGRGADGEIAVAFAFVRAQRADALHIAQHQRLRACESLFIDPEKLEQLWHFVRGVRPLPDQFVEVGGRNPEFTGNAIEFESVELT